MGSIQKKSNKKGRGRGEDIAYFLKRKKNCGLFRFVTLEIPDKIKLRPSALEKLCYTSWNFQDQKPRLSSAPPGNANSFFNWPLELPQYNFSLFPQEISGLQPSPPVCNFFWSRFQKNSKPGGGGGRGILFWNAPFENFRFVALPLEILEKTSLSTPGNSAKLCATILKLEITRSKIKTQGNFTSVFL